MSDIYRVCPKCGGRSNETTYRFCPTCGADSDLDLAVPDSSLISTASKAALPLFVSVTGVVLRFGWKLLQSRMAASALHNTSPITKSSQRASSQSASPQSASPTKRAGRRIHIRSAWTMRDSKGNWRREDSEHIIDLDDSI